MYRFWIRRNHNYGMEVITITAMNANAAVTQLPGCVAWGFMSPA